MTDHWLQLMSLRVSQQKNNCVTLKNALSQGLGCRVVNFDVEREKKFQAGLCVKGRNEPCMLQQVFDVVAGARGLGQAGTRDGDAQREVFASLLEANTFSCFWPRACNDGGVNAVNASLAKLMAQLEA